MVSPPIPGRLPTNGMPSHILEGFPDMESFPRYGKAYHVLGSLPGMGRLTIYGKSSHIWESRYGKPSYLYIDSIPRIHIEARTHTHKNFNKSTMIWLPSCSNEILPCQTNHEPRRWLSQCTPGHCLHAYMLSAQTMQNSVSF
jgi:hypothetical protein